jgi:hypothetical protein
MLSFWPDKERRVGKKRYNLDAGNFVTGELAIWQVCRISNSPIWQERWPPFCGHHDSPVSLSQMSDSISHARNLDTINGANRLLPHYTCAILAHMVLGIYVGIGVEKNACCFHTALRSRKMEWRTIFLEEIIARVRVHFAKMAFAKAKAQS